MNILLFFVALIGLLLPMSRTGVVTFVVAMVVLAMLERKRMVTFFKGFMFASIPIVYIGYMWWDTINEILSFRTHIDYSRLELYENSIRLFFMNPLTGVGYNNYAIAREKISLKLINEPNAHNSWLSVLLELGLIGFLFKIAFLVYMVYAASRRKSMLARTFTATVIGLAAGGLFTNVLYEFYTNFFFVMVFTIILLEYSSTSHIKPYYA
jgi:O-antigen ligase